MQASGPLCLADSVRGGRQVRCLLLTCRLTTAAVLARARGGLAAEGLMSVAELLPAFSGESAVNRVTAVPFRKADLALYPVSGNVATAGGLRSISPFLAARFGSTRKTEPSLAVGRPTPTFA
jgi:hypothetical protein